MDIEQEILLVRSKAQVEKIVGWIGNNKDRFDQLMGFYLKGETDLAKKSAWIASHCVERHPSLALSWMKRLLIMLQKPDVDDALKRNALRIFSLSDIPRSLQGIAADVCFKFLSSTDESIGVHAFSINVISKIAKNEPDLIKELELVVRRMLPFVTPAFKSQAKRALKKTDVHKSILSPENEWENIQDWLHRDVKKREKDD